MAIPSNFRNIFRRHERPSLLTQSSMILYSLNHVLVMLRLILAVIIVQKRIRFLQVLEIVNFICALDNPGLNISLDSSYSAGSPIRT